MRLIVCLGLLLGAVGAQALELKPADPGALRLGDTARFHVDLPAGAAEDASGWGPLPQAEGLVLQPGGSALHEGRVRLAVSVRALRVGHWEIPSLLVEAGSRRHRTRPQQIEVEAPDHAGTGLEVRWAPVPARVEVGEELQLDLLIRIPLDWGPREFIPLFRRGLDLPLSIAGAHIRDSEGALQRLELPAFSGPSLVFAGKQVAAVSDREVDVQGRSFREVRVRAARMKARAAGQVTLTDPWLDFAFATRFRDSFAAGREPVDLRRARVGGAAVTIEVGGEAANGPSAAFAGPVGQFALRASIDRLEVELEGSITLEIELLGEGELRGQGVPDAPRSADFEFEELKGEGETSARVRRFRLRPQGAGEFRLPVIEFAYFDTAAGAPRVARAELGLVRVSASSGPPWGLLAAGAGMALALGGFYLSRRKAVAPEAEQGPSAHEEFLGALEGQEAEPRAALVRFLSRKTGLAEAALDAADLGPQLEREGIERGLALDTAQAMADLMAAEFGRGAASDIDLAGLARRWELVADRQP